MTYMEQHHQLTILPIKHHPETPLKQNNYVRKAKLREKLFPENPSRVTYDSQASETFKH